MRRKAERESQYADSNDRETSYEDADYDGTDELSVEARPRTGTKRTVMRAIRQIPSYLRLLAGLMVDGRVSWLNRLLVVAVGAYMVSPLDFIPDVIPFLGQVDDIFLLLLALQRLIGQAGRRVLLDHWRGRSDELEDLNIAGVISAAAFFLPPRLRRRIRRVAGRI